LPVLYVQTEKSMRKKFCFIVICITAVCMYSCSALKEGSEKTIETDKEYAEKKLGSNILKMENISKTHVLMINQEKETALNPAPLLKFMLFEIKSNRLLFEDVVPAGNVRWINDRQIEILKIPGTVSIENKKSQSGYIFDIDSGRKIELANTINN
jgi:hypothetical protein